MNRRQEFAIAGRKIGEGHPVFLVAEMSANHHQNLGTALDIVRAAKEAGADAIKVQNYTPDTMTIAHSGELFQTTGTIWQGTSLHELYKTAYTPWDWFPLLCDEAKKLNLLCFSTPFDATAVDFLEQAQAVAYKIASFEIVDIPLLKKVARTGKPVIMSTGMATFEEIQEAVDTLRQAGCQQLALLHCTSAYPAAIDEMNIRTMAHMKQAFGVPVGLSDHSLDMEGVLAAVALGACIIEKHFTLSRGAAGPDSPFSLEPAEFAHMAHSVRRMETALGAVSYEPQASELVSRTHRRSLFAVEDIRAGEALTNANVRCIRPAYGLHPRHLDEVLSKQAATDIVRGTPLSWDLVR